MRKTLALILSSVFAVFLLISPICADRTLGLVVDEADLLTDYEEATLTSELEGLSEELSVEIAVVTVNTTGRKSAMEYADDFYDANGYGYGNNDDGVLLLVNMGEREWWITTHGSCENWLSDGVLYTIENSFIDYLSGGDYYYAFSTYASVSGDYIRAAQNGSYLETDDVYDYDYGYDYDYDYDYGYDYEEKSTPMDFILPSIVAGFIISFIMVSIMKGGMNTVRMQSGASEYIVNGSLNVTSQSDNYLYRNVVRTPRQTNHSSGTRSGGSISRSSGGSHRSSSGRSHGGRGGRF